MAISMCSHTIACIACNVISAARPGTGGNVAFAALLMDILGIPSNPLVEGIRDKDGRLREMRENRAADPARRGEGGGPEQRQVIFRNGEDRKMNLYWIPFDENQDPVLQV